MTIVFASVQRDIGLVLTPLIILAVVIYILVNMRRSRPEVGAEIELAPNRKPYYDDEVLEGPRLDRYLSASLLLLGVVAIGLPLYWLAEPARQEGEIALFEEKFASRGEGLYEANCASCHAAGAVGGVAAYIQSNPATGEFIANRQWIAPALNNVLLRYDREEVNYVLDHGRAFSPMQPWSTVGGGAMNQQQIKNIIDYLASIQLTQEEARQEVADGLESVDERFEAAGEEIGEGEALFNLEASAASYSCARCHTQGWSIGQPEATGGGAFGPELFGVQNKFADDTQFAQFLAEGCEVGKLYGIQSQCKSGQMPAFGQYYTSEQLQAIVDYVKTLDGSQVWDPPALNDE